MDEADIREKYKAKPEQAENIIASAKTMLHPQRKTTLYLVLEFKSEVSSSLQASSETKRSFQQEDSGKAVEPPRKKVKAKAKVVVAKPLGAQMKQRAGKLQEEMAAAIAKGAEQQEDLEKEENKDVLPETVVSVRWRVHVV